MEAYEKTLHGALELEHNEIMQQRSKLTKLIKKTNTDLSSSNMRIAKKFGYVNRCLSRRRNRYDYDNNL